MNDSPESYEEMSEGQREDWQRARGVLASERPRARMTLRAKFDAMSSDERRVELDKVRGALEKLEDGDLMGDSREEDPFDRDHRIHLEESLKILTSYPDLGAA